MKIARIPWGFSLRPVMILILALLGSAGVSMAAVDEDRQLLDAVVAGDLALVQTLLEKGADVNAKVQSGATPLMMAAEQGNLDIVRLLLDKGADVNAKDGQDSSALIEASKEGFIEIVKLLLEKGANVSTTDNKSKTAMMYARERRHPKIEQVIKAHRSAPNVAAAPRSGSEEGSAPSEGSTDPNLLDTWELLYQVNEEGHQERPIEGTRLLMEFTDKGQLIFNRMDRKDSEKVKSRTGRFAADGNKISITEDDGSTIYWPYQISGDALVVEMFEFKKKLYWRRSR
jgi:hypothetical protein